MEAVAGEARRINLAAELRGARLIGREPGLNRVIADFGQALELTLHRREVAQGIELEGDPAVHVGILSDVERLAQAGRPSSSRSALVTRR